MAAARKSARVGAAHGGAATSVRAMEPRRQSLAMQRPHIIHIHIPRGTERGDDDGESDRGFSGGDGNDEEGEDLSDVLQPKPRERNQQEIGGVEHELDAHQHDERIAPHDHAQHTDKEHDGRERDVVVDGDRHQSVPSRKIASRIARSAFVSCRLAGSSRISSPPRVITPMTATIRISATTSKGSRCAVKSALPKSPTLPKTFAVPTGPL